MRRRDPRLLYLAVVLTAVAAVLGVLVVLDGQRLASGFALSYIAAAWLGRRGIARAVSEPPP